MPAQAVTVTATYKLDDSGPEVELLTNGSFEDGMSNVLYTGEADNIPIDTGMSGLWVSRETATTNKLDTVDTGLGGQDGSLAARLRALSKRGILQVVDTRTIDLTRETVDFSVRLAAPGRESQSSSNVAVYQVIGVNDFSGLQADLGGNYAFTGGTYTDLVAKTILGDADLTGGFTTFAASFDSSVDFDYVVVLVGGLAGVNCNDSRYIGIDGVSLRTNGQVVPPEVNSPPAIATMAVPGAVETSDTVSISAVATDADGDSLTYQWSQTAGPGTASFSAPTSATGSVTFDAPGNYTISVTVNDNTDSVTELALVVVSDPAPDMHALTVDGGAGSGSYTAGTVVAISADPPVAGAEFAFWSGDAEHVVDPTNADTTVLMPAAAASVTATYTTGAGDFEVGTAVVGDDWTPVALQLVHDAAPVVVCTPQLANNSGPIVVRVRNVTATGFEAKLESVGNDPAQSDTVHYIAMAEGAWTLPGGTRIEAQRVVSDDTNYKNAWSSGKMASYTYLHSYETAPVVLGQVMTANDPLWSTFWSSGDGSANPAGTGRCYVGKHVGQDKVKTRVAETLGVIVIEATSSGMLGSVPFASGVGGKSIGGIDNAPPFDYALDGFDAAPQVALLSIAGMDGSDGGWPVLYGADALTVDQMDLVIDEDQLADNERSHTDERVGYLVIQFGGTATMSAAGSE
jgi:hypothetical protein